MNEVKEKEINPDKVLDEVKKLDGRLISIVCTDEGYFALDYYIEKGGEVNILKAKVPRKKPTVKTISDIYPAADFYEREIHDFFGVEFEGNKNLHFKLELPDDWKGKPPLLKKGKRIEGETGGVSSNA